MVFPFGVVLELIAVEVHLAQVAGGVALGLVVEMLRLGVAAFAASGDCQGMNLGAEFHYRNEAIPTDRHPLAARFANDGTMVCAEDGELLSAIPAGVLYGTVISAEVTGRSSEPYL